MKKTRFFNKEKRGWLLIDAKGKVLGRLAVQIARILQGKHRSTYSPNFLGGNKVVVINVKYLKITGKKREEKLYNKYSGYPGGRKEISLRRLAEKNPSLVLYYAVKGMLPKNWVGKRLLRSLKIYPEDKYPQLGLRNQKTEVELWKKKIKNNFVLQGGEKKQ